MDAGLIGGIATAISLVAFVVATIWALSARRRPDFERVQSLPLEEDVIP